MKVEATNHVLQVLKEECMSALTKEELVSAFNEDGLLDLEGIAEHILKRLRHDLEIQRTEPRGIDFAALVKRTPPEVARDIVHSIPQVPFFLDGIVYEPQDINRFDGQPLLFVPIAGDNGTTRLQIFQEESARIITAYFRTQHLLSLIGISDFPPTWPRLPGEVPKPGDPDSPVWQCGFATGIPCGRPQPPDHHPSAPPPPPPSLPNAPFTQNQIQMFDSGIYTGNWFWLARGYMWTDLTRVNRGGLFGGNWNDKIFSLASTNTWCLYAEHINFEGSHLLVHPYQPNYNLSVIGWHNKISSVWNYDWV